jgi:endonuclease/exonuclease/phosphatase family metal-dependent hydrolase
MMFDNGATLFRTLSKYDNKVNHRLPFPALGHGGSGRLDFLLRFAHLIDIPMTRFRFPKGTAAAMIVLVFVPLASAAGTSSPILKVLTLNVWSGLDYIGTFSVGDYEPPGRRDARFDELVRQVRELDPDILFLQEVNPAGRFARRLARTLGYDSVRDIYLAGIKIGPFGIPTNLREGNAILARPELGLKEIASWRHSGGFGFAGSILSFHFDEIVGSEVARITVRGRPIDLVNVHLHASPSPDAGLEAHFRALLDDGTQTEASFREGMDSWTAGIERRSAEARDLLDRIRKLDPRVPLIVAGDFNAPPEAAEIAAFRDGGPFVDAGPAGGRPTWDPSGNPNVAFSAAIQDARGRPRTGADLLGALDSAIARRLDYVFLGRPFAPEDVLDSRIVCDTGAEGIPPSDHFGLFAEIDLGRLIRE